MGSRNNPYQLLEEKHLQQATPTTPLTPRRIITRECSDVFKAHKLSLGDKLGQGVYGTVYDACKDHKCQAVKLSEIATPSRFRIWDQEVKALKALQKTGLVPHFIDAEQCASKDMPYGVVIEEKLDGDLYHLMQDPFYATYLKNVDHRKRILNEAKKLFLLLLKERYLNEDAPRPAISFIAERLQRDNRSWLWEIWGGCTRFHGLFPRILMLRNQC